jgi:hypothetical protein
VLDLDVTQTRTACTSKENQISVMAKPKAVPMSVPKSRETVESDSDDLDQLGSEDESSEESSSSGEEEDEDRGAPVRSASNGHAKKKNGKYP